MPTPYLLGSRLNRRGQSTVEYMLLISVLVIGAVLATRVFAPGFTAGMQAMQDDLEETTRDGVVGGS